MKNWQKVLNQLKKHEGLSLTPYKCSAGALTIGYGHNLDERGISEEAAELLLKQDAQIALNQAKTRIPCFKNLSEARKYVVIDMLFNLGLSRFMGFKKMLAALDKADYKTAAKEMLNSKWSTQVKSRAQFLAKIMETGKW